MTRQAALRRVLAACASLVAAGSALAHPGHASPGPWSDLAHHVWHLAADTAPLWAGIGVAVLLGAVWRARRSGASARRRRPGRD